MVRLPRNKKTNISTELWASNVIIGFDLDHDLDLDFSRSNMEFTISRQKMVRLPRNKKESYRLNSKPQMWPLDLALAVTLTLNFQGQMWNLLHLSQNGPIATKQNKHIDWTLSLKCDQRIWPWPWSWLWIFKVKYGIHYISAQNGPIVTKQKAKISIEQ